MSNIKGKSAITHQLGEEYSLELIDVRLSQCDPTDLNGFPSMGKTRATYMPMDIFPLEDTAIPKGKKGFLVFLDEFNSASMAVQAASYKLILDRQVGQRKLHSNTIIIAAGNMAGNNAIVNRLGTAMQSRLIHLELVSDVLIWLKWAASAGIDPRVMAYVHHNPEDFHRFDPNHNDKTFACP